MLNIDKNKSGSGVFIDPKQKQGLVDVVVGVDAGSTETRVCVCTQEKAYELLNSDATKDTLEMLKTDVFIIPSTFASVFDEREIQANSDNLEDNYDSHVIRVSSAAVKPLVGSERLVRGRKIKDAAGLVEQNLDSSSNKMDNSIFYLNVLDGIGYALLQYFNGNIPTEVNIHLVLSVRPKEMNSVCRAKMNDNFIGDFIFRWSTAKITLHIIRAVYTTEPEAQIAGTSAIMDITAEVCNDEDAMALSEKLRTSDTYMHIEGGGSSIGVEVVKDGSLMDACSSTFQLGGNYLTRVTSDRLREVKGRQVSDDSVRQAILTGLLRNGREREDVTDLVAGVKRQVALDIVERVRHSVIDVMADLVLTDLEFVTLGGRLFNCDEAGNSIGTYFAEYLERNSPNTEVIVLKDNYIPQGNMIIGINEFTDFPQAPVAPFGAVRSVATPPPVAAASAEGATTGHSEN